MGAPAIAPRPRPARRSKPKPPSGARAAAAPAKRTRPTTGARVDHRARPRVAGGGNVAMLPINAVGGIADSGFVVGMSRGRAWIVLLGVLLGGIVALNVVGLSLSASGSATSTKVDELLKENSVMRARIAHRLSNERITDAATGLGLAVPAPDAVHYLDAKGSDAEQAADRLAQGLIAGAPPALESSQTEPAAETTAVPVDPATVPIDPATAAVTAPPDPTDPALTAPTTPTP